jgi:hypothetical protein
MEPMRLVQRLIQSGKMRQGETELKEQSLHVCQSLLDSSAAYQSIDRIKGRLVEHPNVFLAEDWFSGSCLLSITSPENDVKLFNAKA